MSELKPCPFCGGRPEVTQGAGPFLGMVRAAHRCPKVGFINLADWGEDVPEHVIAAWNSRPREERLEGLLSDIHKRVAKKAMFCAVALEVACGDCPEASTCDEEIIVSAINAALKDEGKE